MSPKSKIKNCMLLLLRPKSTSFKSNQPMELKDDYHLNLELKFIRNYIDIN